MDIHHRFHTPATFRWVRAEHTVIVVVASVVGLMHVRELSWTRFLVAFVAIDLIGYIPGLIAFYRGGRGPIAPAYHHLYNVTHSYLSHGLLVALWAWWLGRFEYAMLAIPIHLSGDRGLFGNTYKPVELPFEPVHEATGDEAGAVAHAAGERS